MIQVTKPFLSPFEEYEAYVRQIWSRNWLNLSMEEIDFACMLLLKAQNN